LEESRNSAFRRARLTLDASHVAAHRTLLPSRFCPRWHVRISAAELAVWCRRAHWNPLSPIDHYALSAPGVALSGTRSTRARLMKYAKRATLVTIRGSGLGQHAMFGAGVCARRPAENPTQFAAGNVDRLAGQVPQAREQQGPFRAADYTPWPEPWSDRSKRGKPCTPPRRAVRVGTRTVCGRLTRSRWCIALETRADPWIARCVRLAEPRVLEGRSVPSIIIFPHPAMPK
jgi:hypothetical protein